MTYFAEKSLYQIPFGSMLETSTLEDTLMGGLRKWDTLVCYYQNHGIPFILIISFQILDNHLNLGFIIKY